MNSKKVNDQHGHGVGDKLLSRPVQAYGADVARNDTLACAGGDEFCRYSIDLPDISVSDGTDRLIGGCIARTDW